MYLSNNRPSGLTNEKWKKLLKQELIISTTDKGNEFQCHFFPYAKLLNNHLDPTIYFLNGLQ